MLEHLETFLQQARDADPAGSGLPRFVEGKLRRYLDCGLLARGFARLRCASCGEERLVALSCKGRMCPSCWSRRAADTAADLVDRLLPQSRGEAALAAAAKVLPPELWNRIEERLVFEPLGRDDVTSIARLLLADSSRRLEREKGIRFEADAALIAHLIDHDGFDVRYGARPMRQTIQRVVEAAVAEEILRGDLATGTLRTLTVADGAVRIASS